MEQAQVGWSFVVGAAGLACAAAAPPLEPDASAIPATPDASAVKPTADGPGRAVEAQLPLAVDDHFVPAGYMGDGEVPGALTEEECEATLRPEGARGLCHRFTWAVGPRGWAGVFWQHPEGNWGQSDGLAIAPRADSVSFYAWSNREGDRVSFIVGMDDVDGFGVRLEEMALMRTPTEYRVDLSAVRYGAVVGGFAWVANNAGLASSHADSLTGQTLTNDAGTPATSLTIFVDDITWD